MQPGPAAHDPWAYPGEGSIPWDDADHADPSRLARPVTTPQPPATVAPGPSSRTRRCSTPVFAASLIVAALIGGTVAAGADALLDGQATAGVSASPGAPRVVVNTGTSDTVAMAAQKATPSVVTLAVSSGTTRGIGSGIVLDAKGDILTNAHVVTLDGATGTPSIQVRSNDNHVYAGTLVGADPLADLAVIRIQAPSLVPAVLAESSKINVGDTAVAIGTPLGLSGTVTKGIVAALNRTISTAPPSAQSAPENPAKSAPQASGSSPSLEVIQTDAAINPGNSGGALVNARGEVIGVNVAIASPSTASAGAQAGNVGIGFAIPIDTAKRIAQEIIASGTATHGQLGIKATTDAAAKGSGFSRGATVTVVTAGSAAEKAGIRKDDVITAINNHPVLDTADLTAAVHEQPSGASVTVTLIRDGHEQSLSATLDPVQP
ncbi:trypsin-like peptidase domain-containing protein (plasmid) [Arthrobacter sp. TES]|uniref:S1C family serine protease n=1 Tax=Paenarthrobacter ureafaciens TaxID=37931 RepID=UPI0003964227|nr:trypsin-like peptidase domain-containing protein [Paenarthrobacter ureafaciens]AOY74126.1 Putative serine protease HhoB [Arthrobacter sp. ZXY-2]QOI65793.1 trypsin-like peptidase domain-containing protein [Arthrobacter sp. TES]GLU61076.1 serine protease [Paenarthrobacter ureafaciens]GLU65345.1 serine protease [Paenarthrobacter ureafaciens]GLU69732.1 serine protease [Paenarthrobacter ureafaciens]